VDESAFKALIRQAVALNGSGKSKPSKKSEVLEHQTHHVGRGTRGRPC